jgi:hypothetical protein
MKQTTGGANMKKALDSYMFEHYVIGGFVVMFAVLYVALLFTV